ALIRRPRLLEQTITEMAAASALPLTLKTRVGWSPGEKLPLGLLERLSKLGVSALALHGRFQTDPAGAPLRLDEMARCVGAASVPVVANGDSFTLETIERMRSASGASGVMLGRGAARKPWIFRDLAEGRTSGPSLPRTGEIRALVDAQIGMMLEREPSRNIYAIMRGRLIWLFHGFEGAADLRRRAGLVTGREQAMELCEEAEELMLGATTREQQAGGEPV
ncbi:tRNA-dihydrouridine synthase family protein, partial [Candidatus Fermentibacterales bacterium]|nr:tRNA-dihydrouridine synthase family protein [Candidatus Fermentibacterales bacterium]